LDKRVKLFPTFEWLNIKIIAASGVLHVIAEHEFCSVGGVAVLKWSLLVA